ncbi:stage II sporulation protein P [Evansella clarkii]|uniref:stage II sporulation protein P n=1 Tax=Evansella clarkii TaxID=79879 RepID=UPI0009974749|nr:stage II sporulation protein P [Evansella clarkii]
MRKHPYRRRKNSAWNRTSIQKSIVSAVLGIISLFFFSSLLTAMGPGYSLSSSSINDASRNISNEMFVYMMGMENRHLLKALPEDHKAPSVTSAVFELATSINPEDPRSLLGRELPGFALFDGRIFAASEEISYADMPVESSPPMEVLMAEREASTERLEEMDEFKEALSGEEELEKVVHIIHSHNRESFFPELKDVDVSDPHQANHGTVNITLAGERLGLELAKRGIGAEVDTSDIGAKLNERGWQYGQSYSMSREVLQGAIDAHGEFEFYFDLHRDSARREKTTVELNGEKYAQILFVIGKGNPEYEKNLMVANDLFERLKQEYPGVGKSVYSPPVTSGRNGVYNQDLSPNSILIEFGGVDNSLEEVYRSVEAFAEVFSDYYFSGALSEDGERE